MKTNFHFPVLQLTLLLLGAAPLLAQGTNTAPADRAARQLALTGSVPVKNAGPYVDPGTFLIQVATMLGQPGAKLADGTWLYPDYEVTNSAATGTLVVRFKQGRVSELTLVTPAAAVAMSSPNKAADRILVATSK